jgi:hypothetical protein
MSLSTGSKIGLGVATAAVALSLLNRKKGKSNPPIVTWAGSPLDDTRARLIVPTSYVDTSLKTASPTWALNFNQGILFPYTPQITLERTATWTPQSITHSNYNFYSYKNSSVGAIRVSAKFTVQNDQDAGIYVSNMLLLNALTKIPFGDEPFAGSPPPVCRFSAYGGFMIDNVPVVVANFTQELPDSVDYYSISKQRVAEDVSYTYFNSYANSVPTLSTIGITLIPVYSRYEQMSFRLSDFMQGTLSRQGNTPGKGYL